MTTIDNPIRPCEHCGVDIREVARLLGAAFTRGYFASRDGLSIKEALADERDTAVKAVSALGMTTHD